MPDKLAPEHFYVPPVGSDELAESLPSIAFWDHDVLRHELETVFRRSWLCVPKQLFREHNPAVRSIYVPPAPGHSHFDVLGMRGNAVRFRILGESAFLFRGSRPKGAPALRCFKNMCPHARYQLLEISQDTDNELRITCQQHGLACDEEGLFIGHPAFPEPTDAQKDRLSLSRYALEEWFDFFFLCREEDPAHPFQEVMQPVLDTLVGIDLGQFRYRHSSTQERIVQGNWKYHAWNYEDWLHIRFIHKRPAGLADAIDLASARMELFPQATLMWAYAADPADGFDPKDLPERFRDPEHPERRVFALWWFVFPNLALNFYPWGLSVNIFMPAIVNGETMAFDPEKTEFLWYHYVWDEQKYQQIESRWLNTLVDFEDIETMRYIAENLCDHSEPWRRGLFGTLPDGPNGERGPWWFNRKIFTTMFEPGAPV